MKHAIITLLILTIINTTLLAQAKIRKLPNNINHPSINVYAPFMSFDANALVFLSDNSEDNMPTMFYTFKENADWKDPVIVPKQINTRLNFLRGYGLSADGKKLYYSSMKSPGVGGYDILMSEFKTSWTEPQNIGSPINSKSNEACPSFTADGNAVYFMRCDKMTQDKAESCKIFMAKKKSTGQWEEPVELPAAINTGNSQTPRIMADDETLIFSSDKIKVGKGMEIFATKFQNGTWSKPIPLDFANTEKDDQYVSVNALGRYLIRDSPGARKNEITEYLIPEDIRPRSMMKIDGKVSDPSGASTPAYISIIDLKTNKRVYNGRPNANGSFLVYLKEGTRYELAIDPEQANISYFTKLFDLTTDKIPQSEKVNAVLKPVAAGDEFLLNAVRFKPNSNELDAVSFDELKKLARLVKGSLQVKFEIQVLLNNYMEDVSQSNADLTEILYDSIKTKVEVIDSLGQVHQHDTVKVRTTYHNDRTLKQAKTIISYLEGQGVDGKGLTYFGNAIQSPLEENRKTIIKAVAKQRK